MYLIESLRASLAEALSAAAGADLHEHLLEYPELPENGDLAFPCFALAKHLKKAPAAIAAEIAAAIALPEGFARVETKGPYLNFFLDRAALVEKAAEEALMTGSRFGDRKVGHDEKVMVEYVSPNNNKPLHLGHVRNGLIGESVSSLLESQGHEVVRAMLLNDRGLAIAKAMVAYAKWGQGRTPEAAGMKGDHFVAEYYVMFESKLKAGEAGLEEEAQTVIRKWEEGDAETRALWKTMGEWCVRGQHETYARLGFRFDAIYKESEIYTEGKAIVEEGVAKGAFMKGEDGHVEAKLEPFGMPDKVLLRSNGTALYITQDLYLAKKKFDDEDLDRSIYVVGNEQNLQMRQLFKILELAGYPWAAKLEHLSYGYVTLPEGRMKSREGTVVDADDLLSALESDAALEIRQRHPALSDDELVRRAHQVALAAVKFYFLEVDIASDMVYDPKASLAFTGKTGPYLQYMHARIRSIVRKAAEAAPEGEGRHAVEEEFRLALSVARFPESVRRAAEQSRPSLVAQQIYEIAKAVAALYEKAQVLAASKEDRDARLKLLEAADAALVRGMALLGFSAPDEM
ncbi:MAG TPA: arginine--tRNA ligase [Candidatus Baltobacteraceae bacterium]|nr:arginine--tRNA ligase [Candidatus Baltobacteraceae bacterium]